jgi:hypothetical protein
MRGFHSSAGAVVAQFDNTDARLLANLATQIAGLLAGREELADDPAIQRMLPDAYRDNAEDAAEFRRFTESDLAEEKIRSALAMAELLTPNGGSDDRVRVSLDALTAFNWMRSFTDIRLALASRLGIVDETSPIFVDDESRYTLVVYNWVGELQYSLVKAIDK